jgi:hypothetical protein
MAASVRSPARHNKRLNRKPVAKNELAAPQSGALLDMELRERHQFKNKETNAAPKV